ncbi:MAG TPA: Sua5/YciO/YrdC/YwlC family protein, partial [bacterium]|nr:Sua5/YciO/YrdC/YwlC family protein [bacterium]
MFISKDEKDIEILAEFIREGKLVAFPTETVYGLGTNASIKESVYR